VSNIRIAEPAVTPLGPINPNKLRNMLLGIFLGLMIGVGLAFLREFFDKTLRTEEDIQWHLNLPVLGVIPEAEKRKSKQPILSGAEGSIATNLPDKNQARSSRAAQLRRNFMDIYPANSSFAEAYRTLRTNIQFSSLDRHLQSFVLTSAIDKEGKTLTTANTAHALAHTGKSVLMIDTDLRKPALSSLVPSAETPGLTGLLSGVFGTEVRNGSLSDFQIGDLFRLLTMQKKTGVLSLSQENEQVELLFFLGKLVDLNWMTRPEDEKLASVLISNGMITEGQARQAFAQQKTTGQKLGFILLNLGLLKKEELTGPLTVHLMEGLRKAFGFNSGSFSFKNRSESDFEPSAFDPVDFSQIYKQLIIGEEPIAYLKQKINEAIVKTHIENLYMLPSGNIPPNPSELLSSDRMSFLLSNLKKRFDFIVIDAPPTVPASDALLIAPHVDGVLLVVKSGSVNRDLVIKAVKKLRMAQINILGVAFNHVNIKKAGYYKNYFKNYANYYAERV
jgi:Mrp family chromosome partitioning ATPase